MVFAEPNGVERIDNDGCNKNFALKGPCLVIDFKNVKWRGNKNMDVEYVESIFPIFFGKTAMRKRCKDD